MKIPKLLDRFVNWLGYVKSVRLSSGAGSLNLFASPARKTRDYLDAFRGWVYACVKARAQEVSSVKLRLYKIVDPKTGEREEVTDHDVLSLLRKVNPFATQGQFIEYTQAYRDLAGEAFWWLVRNPKTNRIMQLWLLRPDWLTVNTDEVEFIKGYTYRPPGSDPIEIPKDDVIHFKEFNPVDAYRGLSLIAAAAATIDSEDFAERYKRKFFENSAVPSVVLQTEQRLDDAIVKRMREQWNSEYQGIDKSHKVAILEAGLTVNPFTVKASEMELLEGMKADADKIRAIFQVPKTVLGMTEDVTVSNAEATDYVFSKRVVKPLMRKLVDTLNEFLLPQYDDGESLVFDFDDPVPENVTAKLERYKTLFAVGAMSPNEIRHAEGLDELDGLDEVYIPFSVIPVTRGLGDGGVDGEEPVKTPRAKPRPLVRPQTMKQKLTDEVSKEVRKQVMAPIEASMKAAIAKSQKDSEEVRLENELGKSHFTEEQQENLWKALVNKSINWEKRYQGLLKQNFERQEKETLERLNSTQKAISPKDLDKILFSLKTENDISVELFLPLVRQILEDVGNDALDQVGLPDRLFDSSTQAVKQFLASNGIKGIKFMNAQTKKQLRKVLAAAISEAISIPDTVSRIKEVYAEATTVRAERIARTETLKSTNRATLEAYKQSNVVVGKQWFTAVDERVCQWCGPMHGRTKALDIPYFHQGEDFVGKEGGTIDLSFEEVGTPPLHPNCRCTIVPILRS